MSIKPTLKPYSDQELEISPEIKDKIEKEMALLDEYGIDYGKFDLDLPSLNLKKGYPNYDAYIPYKNPYNLEKWMQTVKSIYFQEKNGMDRRQAIRQATANWQVSETFDFLNWLKFYEGKNHMKYKTAQLWYENPGIPGYFLHVQKPNENKNEQSTVKPNSIDDAQNAMVDELPQAEKKRIIERQRHKIIGRLDSAEKLLRSHEGHLFAGKELENLIDIIYSLKKKIQLVNKLSAATKIYEDMIIREGNVLNKKGFTKSAEFIYSLAQGMPAPAAPEAPTQPLGSPGGLPGMGPGMPQNPPESAPNDGSAAALNQASPAPQPEEVPEEPTSKGISDFLERMENGNFTETDENKTQDDKLEVSDQEEPLMVEAQVAAPLPESKIKPEEDLTVSDIDEPVAAPAVQKSQDFDSILNSALSNVSVNDVLNKLEDISQICGTRELSRQLALVDIMLNKLNMGVFTELSEAQTKALDSNNYVKTRVDEMLGKIRGSLPTDINLRGNPNNVSPDPKADQIRKKLENDDAKEKMRKQKRKDLENETFDVGQNQPAKETPTVELEEELAKPTPAKPIAPPPQANLPPAAV